MLLMETDRRTAHTHADRNGMSVRTIEVTIPMHARNAAITKTVTRTPQNCMSSEL